MRTSIAMRTLTILLLCLGARTAHAQWGPEVPITSTGGDVWGEGIATSGQTVHMVFGTNEVRYQRSDNEGDTWGADRQLDGGTIHLTDPVIADGNDVWIVYLKDIRNVSDWCCSRDLGNIYMLHSGDSGNNWDAPMQLSTGQGAFRVSITYASSGLHLVWMDYRSGAWDTYYRRSTDRGANWTPERVIAQSAGTFGAERPQVAARGDEVHVTIWDDRGTNPPCMAGPTFSFAVCPDTFYMGSLDGGDTWSAEVPVSYSGAAIAGRNDIAVTGPSSVIVNFNRSTENTADANPHMFVVRSTDNGTNWDTAVQLTDTPGSSDHGSIIGSGSSVYLAWHDSRDGALAIFYRQSTNEGMTWDPEERASLGTTADSSTPLLAVSPGYVHAMWLDHRSGSYQIYYRRRSRPASPMNPDAAPGTGPDASATGPDADDGNPAGGDGGGCGCRTGATAGDGLPVLLIAFALLRPRRRVSRRAVRQASR